MAIRVYNTLTNSKEELIPLHPGKVGIYLCGPTVYMNSHIGHAVGPVIFDTIKRYLTARGYEVTFVHNITDIDDKIIDRAQRDGIDWRRITEDVTKDYLKSMHALATDNFDHMPKATEHIAEIVDLVQGLIDKGFAYEVEGDVYFDISSAKDYGKLSGRKVEELVAGARVAIDERKRNDGDFALWKSAKPGEPSWESPWGRGRPGWHIECSAMSMKYLGKTFDIHGGGIDLIFPHHENEILQSESANAVPFARYWIHNGLTTVDGQKMSKSLGNVVDLSELLERYPPELVRFLILQTHYRSPMNFSFGRLEETRKALSAFHRFLERVEHATGRGVYAAGAYDIEPDLGGALAESLRDARDAFFAAMDDDFNTARAIAALFELLTALNRRADERGIDDDSSRDDFFNAALFVRRLAGLLGILLSRPVPESAQEGPTDDEVERFVTERTRARSDKNYQRADDIRNELARQGVVLEYREDGTAWRRERT